MESSEKGLPSCPDCGRIHTGSQPCPRRIARAIINPTSRNLAELLPLDKAWMTTHTPPGIEDQIDLVEEWLVEHIDTLQ